MPVMRTRSLALLPAPELWALVFAGMALYLLLPTESVRCDRLEQHKS